MNKFHAALYQANLLYGIELNSDKFEEIGLIAWGFIGNKQTRFYKYSTIIDKDDLSVYLPCNCAIIEAVTYGYEDWNYTSNTSTVVGDLHSRFVEDYIEVNKRNKSPRYISGKYARFQRADDKLLFDKDYGKVNILYKGIILDEDDLPYLNDKEVNAIAAYCAFTVKRKEYFKTQNQQVFQQSQILELEWRRLCDAARVPEYINQNDMNEILEARASWDRKVYNKSFKPYK